MDIERKMMPHIPYSVKTEKKALQADARSAIVM